jgi:hypothetical protein
MACSWPEKAGRLGPPNWCYRPDPDIARSRKQPLNPMEADVEISSQAVAGNAAADSRTARACHAEFVRYAMRV